MVNVCKMTLRRVFHELRSRAIENLNEQFKGIFDVHGQVPTKVLKTECADMLKTTQHAFTS
jgi:hypothetical protein